MHFCLLSLVKKNQIVPLLQRAYVAVTPETRHYQDWEGLSYLQGPNANFYPKEGHQSRYDLRETLESMKLDVHFKERHTANKIRC